VLPSFLPSFLPSDDGVTEGVDEWNGQIKKGNGERVIWDLMLTDEQAGRQTGRQAGRQAITAWFLCGWVGAGEGRRRREKEGVQPTKPSMADKPRREEAASVVRNEQ
jgi:hypothetical protein